MNKTLLFSSLTLGLALVGCSKSARTDSATVSNTPAPATNPADALARNAGNAFHSVASTARQVEWKLTGDDLKDDIAAGRTIERSKAGAPTGKVKVDRSDLKKAVEARFRADSDIANMLIDIDADRDGQINLSGKANTVERIRREKHRRIEIGKREATLPSRETRRDHHREERFGVAPDHQREPGRARDRRQVERFGDVEAISLTHADADHPGFAERVRRETNAAVFIPRTIFRPSAVNRTAAGAGPALPAGHVCAIVSDDYSQCTAGRTAPRECQISGTHLSRLG